MNNKIKVKTIIPIIITIVLVLTAIPLVKGAF